MLRRSCAILLYALFSLSLPYQVCAQAPEPAGTRLSFQAALVLTPEFCATKPKKGSWLVNQETFDFSKTVCADLETALTPLFAGLKRVDASSAAGDAQLVLTPRFVDITATQAKFAFSNRELTLQVEWTAKDRAGKTVWIETVEGSAKHHMGNSFTYKKNLKLVVKDASQDLADQSARKISSSDQLRQLADGPASQIGKL